MLTWTVKRSRRLAPGIESSAWRRGKEGILEEMIEYRKQLLRRFEKVMGDLAGALERIPPANWEARNVSGESTRNQVEQFCQIEKSVFFAVIEEILARRPEAVENASPSSPPERDRGGDLGTELERIHSQCQSIIARLDDAPVEIWNTSLRHPQQGLRTLQWWVEQSLAYANHEMQNIFTSFRLSGSGE
jgi:hypothetical protein